MLTTRRLLALPAACLVLAACQGTEPTGMARNQIRGVTAALSANGNADLEEFEVCKFGSSADFSYTIDNRSNGTGVDASGTFTLADGGCTVLLTIGGVGADVSVTETGSQSGFHFDRAEVTTVSADGPDCANPTESGPTTQTDPTATGVASGVTTDGKCHGTLVEYFNSPDEQLEGGRMTGGGGQIIVGDVQITRGFTIHCDIILSNNLEINWPDNKWHLDKPLTSARCIDDPNIDPAPPPAPFDTFIGEGIGQLNGVDGALVKFTFIDSGEPGGSNDLAQIQVFDPGGNLVLDVPMSFLDHGNIQAHYDQPHK